MSEDLRVALSDLRGGPVDRHWRIEDPTARFGALPLAVAPVDIAVRFSGNLREGVRVRGKITSRASVECRRCLTPGEVAIEADLDAWFRSREQVTSGEEGVWGFDPATREVDVSDAVREELWMALPEYSECDEECVGMCAHCGARLAEEPCTCAPPEPDPRWAALRTPRG